MFGADVGSVKGSSVMWVSPASVNTRDTHIFHTRMQD